MRKLYFMHHLRLMAAATIFAFSLAAVTATHAQAVFENWESADVDEGEGIDGGWSSDWTFYHSSPTIQNTIRTLNRTGHPEGFTKLGYIASPDLGGLPQTWATLGDTLFTNTQMSSDVGSHDSDYMRVGLVTRFTADVNDDFSYYMARWAGDDQLELIKTTGGNEVVLNSVGVLHADMEGTLPRSSLSFSVMNIAGQAHLEATFIGANSGGSNEYSISAVDQNPLGEGRVGIYGRTTSTTSRAFSFDNFQAAVPEPASIGLLVGGLALMMTTLRRRRKTGP